MIGVGLRVEPKMTSEAITRERVVIEGSNMVHWNPRPKKTLHAKNGYGPNSKKGLKTEIAPERSERVIWAYTNIPNNVYIIESYFGNDQGGLTMKQSSKEIFEFIIQNLMKYELGYTKFNLFAGSESI